MKRLGVAAIILAALNGAALGSASTRQKPTASSDAVNGRQVYVTQKCSVCHKIAGTGGLFGPDLTTVGSTRDAAWLTKYITNPTPLDPKYKVKMPPQKLKDQDLADLVAYLRTLKVKK